MGWKYTLGSLMYSGTERLPREHGARVESGTQEMPSLRTLGRRREGAVRGETLKRSLSLKPKEGRIQKEVDSGSQARGWGGQDENWLQQLQV